MATLPKSYLSEQEYLEIERAAEFKSEYLDGQMFAMAGAAPAHAKLVTNLTGLLWLQLKAKGYDVFGSDMRIKAPRGNFYAYPDLSAVCTPHFTEDRPGSLINPVLIVEVLSPSTRHYDSGEKFRRYRTIPSFVEYLLVDQSAVFIEHWLRQPNGSWVVSEFEELENEVLLESVGCRFRLADVYAGVEIIAS